MKAIKIIGLGLGLCLAYQCQSNPYATLSKEVVQQKVNENQFTFMAKRANPLDQDVTRILNSFPTGNSQTLYNLDDGYTVKVTPDSLSVDLPYFGRAYQGHRDPSKNGLKLETQTFSVRKKRLKKSFIYEIDTPNEPINQMVFEIFDNGKAYLSVTSRDKQPISFDGYIVPKP